MELMQKVSLGEVTREEILNRLGMQNVSASAPVQNHSSVLDLKNTSINKIMYTIGAAIVLIGIVIFVGQIWEDIGSFGRILVTLGVGLMFTIGGVVLSKSQENENLSSIFHAMGGLLIPGGSVVLLDELKLVDNNVWPICITFGAIFVFYLLLNYAQKKVILTFFSIANGTAFIYLLVEAMIDSPFYKHGDLYAYLTMVIGISYVLLAKSFEETWNQRISNIMYLLGSFGFYGAAFSQVYDSGLWQMLYFILVFGGLFISTQVKSRSVLVASTLFLIVHISYITGEYFADSLGWPVSLIALGFIFIGLGYVSININKNYIAK